MFGCSSDLCQKCAEWGIKELSWAELGRRVGHKELELEGEGEGGSVRELPQKGVGWRRDLVLGQAHGGWGVDVKRKGKRDLWI